MKAAEDIRPVSYLKARAAALLDQVNDTRRPVIITQSGTARAVLQDPETYEQMRAAIGMLKLLVQGEEDARAGRVRKQGDVFARLQRRLARKRKGP
jgi:prevent-host-death family protein